MKTLLANAGLALLFALATEPGVNAQEAPEWMKQTLPEPALKPHWDEYLAVMNPTGALDAKTKQLIALGVAAQIRLYPSW
jgi:alkylhydroperoxidase/carboxymuconolactone decarboxylase family protein YurZ